MSEYIEKSALLEAIKAVKPDMTMNLGAGAYMTPHEAAWDMYNDVKDVIEDATTADVVPVIRCKNCQNFNNKSCVEGYGYCLMLKRTMKKEEYCCYGKGKNNESEDTTDE